MFRTPGAPIGSGMEPARGNLGTFVRIRRLKLNLSQRSLATRLGWEQAKVSHIERGRHPRLSKDEAAALARVFAIRPERLLRLNPPPLPLLPPRTPLARFIRARREALGLSRMELARLARTTNIYLGTLEQTTRYLKYSLMLRLAKALGLDPSKLAPFAAPSAAPPPSPMGRLIHRRRKQLGLSLREVARRVGVAKPAILAIERGRVSLRQARSQQRIRRLARVLRLNPAELEQLRPVHGPRRPASPKTFGGRIARRRQERRWTQAELARRAALSPAAVCNIERNHVRPHDSSVRRLAAALDMDERELFQLRPPQRR